ncbi:arginyl-tRNA synthetase [Bacillus tianshenii]|uniref:Arginine--tRNA ligase n=1 Tax=Sutcliffiella tianshenii TaxID=1463404 RepID=A0ABS2P4E2_9BACI|nr:arginine--tRNA ligase [Bacillus tianshenii]MBM7621497.1 arginyl-tRNA synthetase [Bacillus tianshenii]
MNIIHIIASSIQQAVPELNIEQISIRIEKPKYANHGDFAFPVFDLAKIRKQAPQAIASSLAGKIQDPWVMKTEAVGPYVNFFLQKEKVQKEIISNILAMGKDYGNLNIGKGENVVLDLSSPNIAKPFSMGHLRSTVIGTSIANILEKCGYQTVRINYLGDWGTQFGKLIVAYLKWGSAESVRENPIPELLKLYVKFHQEAADNPALDDEGRLWFKRLEDGNEDARSLWKWFREESLHEFQRIYDLLGIRFDSYNGEAFYNDKMDAIIERLKELELLTHSDGAEVVVLDESLSLPPCLIKKSDGATLYATRDLAAAFYRKAEYKFAKALYVVGQEQTIHFQQVKAVVAKMGESWAKDMHHIPFGLLLKDGKKMSTRKGKVILLEKVIQEAIELAERNIAAKNPQLPNKQEVAKQVGVGAIIFHDLKNYRLNSIEFSLGDMLKFEGETGPYVQYTHARASSILRKASWVNDGDITYSGLKDDYSWNLSKLLYAFPETIEKACAGFDPSIVAKYIVDVCQSFNSWYGHEKFLTEDEEKVARLSLVYATTLVIQESLSLLGMSAPDEM